MKNTIAARKILETALLSKRVVCVEVHNSHGEVLELIFEDGATLKVCSTAGLSDKSITEDPHSIYLSLNDKAL